VQAALQQVEILIESCIGDDVIVKIDKLRTQQIMINLVSNAIKYSNRGGKVKIIIEHANHQLNTELSEIKIHVIDHGPGIPVCERDLVFQPYYRCKKEQRVGHGLGLSICREIASQLGFALKI
jgi:two-component system, OmpR family, sensor kinase